MPRFTHLVIDRGAVYVVANPQIADSQLGGKIVVTDDYEFVADQDAVSVVGTFDEPTSGAWPAETVTLVPIGVPAPDAMEVVDNAIVRASTTSFNPGDEIVAMYIHGDIPGVVVEMLPEGWVKIDSPEYGLFEAAVEYSYNPATESRPPSPDEVLAAMLGKRP